MPCRPCQAKRQALQKALAEKRFAEAAKVTVIGAGQMIGIVPKDKAGDETGKSKPPV